MNTFYDRSYFGYSRVSTQDQYLDGYGIDAQRDAIDLICAQRGMPLAAHFTDAASGQSLQGRPALQDALALLDSGEANGLVVAKIDRLSRSLSDAAAIMDRAQNNGWSLVILDLGIDTSTPHGQLLTRVMASISDFELAMISSRTRAALAAAQARGVHVGRPRTMDQDLVDRIVELRDAGLTYQAICDILTEDGVPTARGGARWYPATISKVLAVESRAQGRTA